MSKEEIKEKFSFELIVVLKDHGGAVTSMVCSEDENNEPLLISGPRDKSFIRWKLNLDNPREVITKLDDEEV